MKTSSVAAVFSFALSLSALTGCATTAQVYTHQSQRFTQYTTFSLASADTAPARFRRAVPRQEISDRVQGDLGAILTERGYHAAASGSGDLIVRYGVGEHIKREIPEQQDDATGAQTDQTNVEETGMDAPFNYTEAALVVDMFDAKTSVRVWHGVAREVISTHNVDTGAIDKAVRQLLANFPIAATAVAK